MRIRWYKEEFTIRESINEPVHVSPSAIRNFELYTCPRADRQSLQGPVPLVTEWYPLTRAMFV